MIKLQSNPILDNEKLPSWYAWIEQRSFGDNSEYGWPSRRGWIGMIIFTQLAILFPTAGRLLCF